MSIRRAAETVGPAQNLLNLFFVAVNVSVRSVGGQIATEAELDLLQIKGQVAEIWKACFLTGDCKLK